MTEPVRIRHPAIGSEMGIDGNAAADSDADFAAWSHNNTPAMLEELERLESLLQLCSDISGCLANLTRCRSETNGA